MTNKDKFIAEQLLREFQLGRDLAQKARREKDAVESTKIAVAADTHFDRVKTGLRTLLGWEE